jgi:glycosyltransferase involved in cell wall biosynthesis
MMMELLKVSVIIPTHNRADTLGSAIQSVLEQTYLSCEVIVVDDGSDDSTRTVVDSFSGSVRYFYQTRRGPSAARNTGIQKAEGEFLSFLDSDDLFLPGKIASQVMFLTENPQVGMVHSSYISVDYDLVPKALHIADSAGSTYRRLMLRCSIATPTVMVRREVFDRVGRFDESMDIEEDIDMWIRIARVYRVGVLHEPLSKVRVHLRGIPRDPERIVANKLHLLNKAFACDQTLDERFKHRALATAYLDGFAFAAKKGGHLDHRSRTWLRQAFASDPPAATRSLVGFIAREWLLPALPPRVYARLRTAYHAIKKDNSVQPL